jgi:hypothetical protein
MLHGEALLRARRTELDPLITEQRELAAGRDDIRGVGRHRCRFMVRFAGHRLRHELIAAGLLLVSGPVDRDLLLQWVRTGYERGRGTWLGYGLSDRSGRRLR